MIEIDPNMINYTKNILLTKRVISFQFKDNVSIEAHTIAIHILVNVLPVITITPRFNNTKHHIDLLKTQIPHKNLLNA